MPLALKVVVAIPITFKVEVAISISSGSEVGTPLDVATWRGAIGTTTSTDMDGVGLR